MTPPADDVDTAFEGVCAQLAGFDERLGSEWIDGYLTALVAGPRVVPATEWLPRLAGDAFERTFADPHDEQRALGALMGRWNAIAATLQPEPLDADPDTLRLRPVLHTAHDDGRTDAATGMDWAAGFLQATDDFEWRVPDRADAAAREHYDACLRAIDALTQNDDDEAEARDALIDEACFAVQDLRLFWIDHAPRPVTVRVPKAPGRNDPCPCGSGRKFKKCCGASA